MCLREFYKFLDKPYYFFRPCLICWLLFAHYQNRAVGVADYGIGDATQHRSPYTAKASATYNNQTSPYLLCQSSNLRVRPSYSEMSLGHTASSGFDLPYLLVESALSYPHELFAFVLNSSYINALGVAPIKGRRVRQHIGGYHVQL